MKFLLNLKKVVSTSMLLVLIVGILPTEIPKALAADTLFGPVDTAVIAPTEFVTGAIDASGHENLVLNFDYNAQALDGTGSGPAPGVADSFTYGWRTGATDTDLATVVGEPTSAPSEIGNVSMSLPNGAQVNDLEIYISVSANSETTADQLLVTNLTVEGDLLPCSPQFDASGPTDIQNTNTGDYFDSVNDALADCDTSDGDTISLLGDITIGEQITLDRPIIFDGAGFTIDADFAKTSNSNNSAIGVQSDDVTVTDVILDGTNGTNLHGVNVYVSEGVDVGDVHAMNFRSGMVVNGSTVDATNFTTAGNIWHGINVAPGGGVTTPSILNISATSEHAEERLVIPHIFTDDVTAGTIEVNDLDDQYESFEFGNAKAYWIKQVPSLEITNPPTDGDVLEPMPVTFTAEYVDADETEDNINWAIYAGSCSNDGTNRMAGNAEGDPSDLTGTTFSADVNMSAWPDGEYCFVVNPNESGEGEDFRETRLFSLEALPSACHLPYIVEFSEDSDDDTFSTTPGDTGLVIEEVSGGYTIGFYDDGRDGIYRVAGTIIFPEGTDTASFTFEEALGNDGLEQNHNTYPDVADRSGNTIEFDFYSNGAGDIFTITDEALENNSNCEIVFPALPDPSLTITAPEENEVLEGEYQFTAEYVDADETEDNINWAIYAGSCSNDGTNRMAGNAEGDPSDLTGTTFSADVNMSAWPDGEYCFVVNPNESGEGEDFRETRLFALNNLEPAQCVLGENILKNSSFEEPEVTDAKGWGLFSPIEWVVKKVSDDSDADMELQSTVNGWSHSDGNQHTELAGEQANITSQTVATVPGETYTLSWDYSPRPGKSFGDNKLEVFVDGVEVETNQETGIGLNDTVWTTDTHTFVATDEEVVVAFKDAGDSNGSGPFLDNTSLVCGDPEESIYLLSGSKFEDTDGNGEWGENELALVNWPIFATNGVEVLATTTDEFGNYYFLVTDEGTWEVYEETVYTYEQTAPADDGIGEYSVSNTAPGYCSHEVGQDPGDTPDFQFASELTVEADVKYEYDCLFGNQYVGSNVDGFKFNDINGNGVWDENEGGIQGWEIEITNGTETFATTTDQNGYYSFVVEDDNWIVSEVPQENWNQTAPVSGVCEFNVAFDPEADYTCDFGNQFQGESNSNGSLTCTLKSDGTDFALGKDATLTWSSSGGTTVTLNNNIGSVSASGQQTVVVDNDITHTLTVSDGTDSVDCSVNLTVAEREGLGGNGSGGGEVLGVSTSAGKSSGSSSDGQVLGASTDICTEIGLYLNDYLRIDFDNDPWEVIKLQLFLSQQGFDVTVNGIFDEQTFEAVSNFQALHEEDILQPWVTSGFASSLEPTGYVYKMTRWKVNETICLASVPLPTLP